MPMKIDPTMYFKDGEGALRWVSNDSVIPPSVWEENEMPVMMPAIQPRARERHLERVVAAYRWAQKRRTPEQIAEQRAEARAAHGPGVTLVDVVTGERYTT